MKDQITDKHWSTSSELLLGDFRGTEAYYKIRQETSSHKVLNPTTQAMDIVERPGIRVDVLFEGTVRVEYWDGDDDYQEGQYKTVETGIRGKTSGFWMKVPGFGAESQDWEENFSDYVWDLELQVDGIWTPNLITGNKGHAQMMDEEQLRMMRESGIFSAMDHVLQQDLSSK